MSSLVVALSVLVVLAVPTALVGGSVLAVSMRRQRSTDRDDDLRPQLRSELLERLFADDPEWAAWVDECSPRERRVVVGLVERYLRLLRGSHHDDLVDLAWALGVVDRSLRQLHADDVRDRRRALTWLALLRVPVDADLLFATCTDRPSTRAGAAAVLQRSAHPDADELGATLLCWSGEGLSAFGVDTLYHCSRADPSALCARAIAGVDAWEPPLLEQALHVLECCLTVDAGWQLEWVFAVLDHDDPTVRAAAVAVLDRHGWLPGVLARVDLQALLCDPDPVVRRRAYEFAVDHGDRPAYDAAVDAARAESPRTQLGVARRSTATGRVPDPVPSELVDAYEWARAERIARGRVPSRSGGTAGGTTAGAEPTVPAPDPTVNELIVDEPIDDRDPGGDQP